MARLAELRKTAKGMGIAPNAVLKATTVSALEKVIADHKHKNGNSKPKAKAKAKAKAKVAKAVKKVSGRKASTPAKSKGAKAKRSSNSNGNGNGGRNTLGNIDFSVTDDWNPRSGSAPDRIIKCLKKFRGNRTKAFEALKGDVWDFVGKKKANGTKRTKAEAESMLKYRIHRTLWDFAMRTGQHEASANRVKYGTGGTGEGTFKPAKAGRAQKASKPNPKLGRPKGSKNAPKAQKAAQKRTTGAKRGRPKAKARR